MISFCKMNLANYPFDEQTCNIYFESCKYIENFVANEIISNEKLFE